MFIVESGEKSGTSRAPKQGEPDSSYEQKDSEGNTRSKTKYNDKGLPGTRDDYDHSHYDKKTGKKLNKHRHSYRYNEKGQRIGEDVVEIP